MAAGRPSDYTIEMSDRVIECISSSGEGIYAMCNRYDDLPAPSTIFLWVSKHPEFSERYKKAKMAQQLYCLEEANRVACDDSNDLIDGRSNSASVARSKLRVETIFRQMDRLAPRDVDDKEKTLAQATEALSLMIEQLNKSKERDY